MSEGWRIAFVTRFGKHGRVTLLSIRSRLTGPLRATGWGLVLWAFDYSRRRLGAAPGKGASARAAVGYVSALVCVTRV